MARFAGLTCALIALALAPASAHAGAWKPLPEPGERKPAPKEKEPAEPAPARPLLVVYPFACADAVFGAKLAKVVRGKLLRTGRFAGLAEIEEEERLEASPAAFHSSSDPFEVAAHARKVFTAAVAFCGSAEREGEGFRLRLVALDLRGAEPVRMFSREFEGENVHWAVQAAKEVAAAMTGEKAPAINRPAPRVAALGPEMLANGGFEKRRTFGWTGIEAGMQLVQHEGWKKVDRCLRYELTKKVAETTGLFCYSEYVEIEKNASYRVAFDVRTEKPSVIIFVKGYAQLPNETTGEPEPRMVYNYQKRHYPKEPGAWERLETHAFTPTHPKWPPTTLRVMLYTYLKPGRVEFDNVSVRKATLATEE